VTIGRGARQTIYALGATGAAEEVPVVVGSTDGAWTIVSGEGLTPGLRIITGELASMP
jgi:HlyD family secretion protein